MKVNYKEFVKDRYGPGYLIPWWKGYVDNDACRYETIVAPIPFNLVYSLILFFYHSIRRGMLAQMRFLKEQKEVRAGNANKES